MKNKKIEWLRVLIFIVISFALAWLPWKYFLGKYGMEGFLLNEKFSLFTIATMFPPAIAHILTRLITKEGWKGMKLHLNFKGNLKYYFFSMLYVFVQSFLSGAIAAIYAGDRFSFEKMKEVTDFSMLPVGVIYLIPLGLLLSFYVFGEEFGWRAYLYPKLEKLLNNAPIAGIIGGIIWGLWHMPLTNVGYNFGTDYPGFPWYGNILMCINCISMGMVMMYVTKKTGSVYPACILHAINNNGGSIFAAMFASGLDSEGTMAYGIMGDLLFELPGIIAAVICAVLMVREAKKAKLSSEPEQESELMSEAA